LFYSNTCLSQLSKHRTDSIIQIGEEFDDGARYSVITPSGVIPLDQNTERLQL